MKISRYLKTKIAESVHLFNKCCLLQLNIKTETIINSILNQMNKMAVYKCLSLETHL